MSRRTIILLIALFLTIATATIMAEAAHPDDEVTVTDLKRELNSDEELVVKKPSTNNVAKKAATKTQPEVTVNTKKNFQRKAEEASKEYVNRRQQQQRQEARSRDDTIDSWFNRPRCRTNQLFRNSLFDNNERDVFGGAFRDFFGGVNPFGRRHRGSFGRNIRPFPSLLSGIFDGFEPSFPSSLLGSGRWPALRREPINDLFGSFDKLVQDFKQRPARDEWKEASGAYELRVNLPEGMNKDNIQVEVEKDNAAGRHTLLIHGKAEKHDEVKKQQIDSPQLQDSGKQEQAEPKQTAAMATQETKDATAATKPSIVSKFDHVSELQRRYAIPSSVDANNVSAEIQGNTLVITLSKKPETVNRRRKIAVNIE